MVKYILHHMGPLMRLIIADVIEICASLMFKRSPSLLRWSAGGGQGLVGSRLRFVPRWKVWAGISGGAIGPVPGGALRRLLRPNRLVEDECATRRWWMCSLITGWLPTSCRLHLSPDISVLCYFSASNGAALEWLIERPPVGLTLLCRMLI